MKAARKLKMLIVPGQLTTAGLIEASLCPGHGRAHPIQNPGSSNLVVSLWVSP